MNEYEYQDLIKIFEKFATRINETKQSDNKRLHEKNIIRAYNNIIKFTKDYWSGNDSELKTKLKRELSPIYFRLKAILGSNVTFPRNLSTEIKFEQSNTDEDEILQSTVTYDKDIFNALLDEFDDWDHKIIRKNASQKDDIVAERTENIINSYNNLIEFAKTILNSENDEESKSTVRKEIEARKEFIKEDLNILNADVEVPESISEKIHTQDDDNKGDDNKKTDNTNVDPLIQPDIDPTIQPQIDPTNNDKKQQINPKIQPPIEPPKTDNKKSDENKSVEPNNSHLNFKKGDDNPPKQITPEPIIIDHNKMALTLNDYYNMCTRQLSKIYEGDPLGLFPFIASIELLQKMDKENVFTDILLNVVMTKLQGIALESIPKEDVTIQKIIDGLKKNIKSDNSEIIEGKIMALKADKNNLTDFTERAELLAEEMKRALMLEDIPNEKATKMTTKAITELCRANTNSTLVKACIASEHFDTPKDAIAKFVIETRSENNEKKQQGNVFAAQHTNRYFNNRNRFQRNRYANHNRNYDRNGGQNRHAQRGRGNFRGGNLRGRGNNGNNYRGNQYGSWRDRHNRGRVFYAENNESPPSGGTRQVQQADQ